MQTRLGEEAVCEMLLTAGLDSFTASEVMEVVKGLVTSGITIAATIHSPTPRTFELFDRVLILQRGRIVYFGDNGDSAQQYFTSSPYFQVTLHLVVLFVFSGSCNIAEHLSSGSAFDSAHDTELVSVMHAAPDFAESYAKHSM